MEKKMSAVEFLFKEIYGDLNHIGSYTINGNDVYETYKKALNMEWLEITNAFTEGHKAPKKSIKFFEADSYYESLYNHLKKIFYN